MHVSQWIRRSLSLCALGACATMAGCNLAAIIAAPLANFEREGSTKFDAEYKGLSGKTFAVMISAPPVIQASFGETVPRMTVQISEILAKTANASGYVPGPKVIEYQYNRPAWVAKPWGEVARDLGVERIVYIDLTEYRLQDIGNQYLWDGVAAGLVAVVEADGPMPDDLRYQKRISVKFPDTGGYGPGDMPLGAVNTELTNRFVTRVTWLFYEHEEANKLTF